MNAHELVSQLSDCIKEGSGDSALAIVVQDKRISIYLGGQGEDLINAVCNAMRTDKDLCSLLRLSVLAYDAAEGITENTNNKNQS